MNKRIWLSLAHMGGREQDFIKEAFDTNWVVPLGPNVDAFEQSLVEYFHEDRYVVALSAGTAALHLGLILLDVKPGDEVICQSFTFAASANPISYLEAKPVFVDRDNSLRELTRLAQTVLYSLLKQYRIHIPGILLTVHKNRFGLQIRNRIGRGGYKGPFAQDG